MTLKQRIVEMAEKYAKQNLLLDSRHVYFDAALDGYALAAEMLDNKADGLSRYAHEWADWLEAVADE